MNNISALDGFKGKPIKEFEVDGDGDLTIRFDDDTSLLISATVTRKLAIYNDDTIIAILSRS